MDKPWLKHYEPGVPANIFYPRVPLHHFLEEAARKHPNNTALIFHDAKITYQQLNALADKFASALVNLGVKKGDRVALYLPNCPQFVLGFYGALKAGAVAVPINPLYVEREVQHQLNDAGAETILVLSRYYPLLQKIRAQTGLKNVIATNIKEYFTPLERTRFTLTREQREGHRVTLADGDRWLPNLLEWSPAAPRVIVEPEDTAILQYTGGMTGVPKAAMGTHRNLVANSLQL
ncbi:MAG: AMP-binding protein, partial [Chloroflexi bacterium]|nr:AMP-binding protein [Chloroflexota bacterium]